MQSKMNKETDTILHDANFVTKLHCDTDRTAAIKGEAIL